MTEQENLASRKKILGERNRWIGIFAAGVLTAAGSTVFMESARYDNLSDITQRIVLAGAGIGIASMLGATGAVLGLESRLKNERLDFLEDERTRLLSQANQSPIRRT